MKKHRKTVTERRYARDEAARKIGESFLPELEACQNIVEATVLWREAVPEGKPGREYYSNLGFFLINSFAPPDGATGREIAAYTKLIERDPALEPDQKRRIIAMLASRSRGE